VAALEGVVALVVKAGSELAARAAEKVLKELEALGAEAAFAEEFGAPRSLESKAPLISLSDPSVRFAIVIGGDGTFLKAAKHSWKRSPTFALACAGRRCFYYDTKAEEAAKRVRELALGKYRLQLYPYFLAEPGCGWGFLNEAVVAGDHKKVVRLEVRLGFQKLFNVHGDGVVVASASGSTAYALSAGGPVVDHDSWSLVIAPLNPVQLDVRPVVTSALKRVSVLVSEDTSCEPELILDGEPCGRLKAGSSASFRFSGRVVRVARFERISVYGRLLGRAQV